jgi:TetR/AcrR family transcriptional repressor of nem operon
MADGTTDFAQALKAPVVDSTTPLQRYVEYYLSPAHRDNIDYGCPVSGFAGDAPRIGAKAQSNFAHGLDDQITLVAGLIAENGAADLTGQHRTLRERAISLHCQMVGALILSRSVKQAAPAFSEEILKNVLRDVSASIDPLSNPTSAKARKPRRPAAAQH